MWRSEEVCKCDNAGNRSTRSFLCSDIKWKLHVPFLDLQKKLVQNRSVDPAQHLLMDSGRLNNRNKWWYYTCLCSISSGVFISGHAQEAPVYDQANRGPDQQSPSRDRYDGGHSRGERRGRGRNRGNRDWRGQYQPFTDYIHISSYLVQHCNVSL